MPLDSSHMLLNAPGSGYTISLRAFFSGPSESALGSANRFCDTVGADACGQRGYRSDGGVLSVRGDGRRATCFSWSRVATRMQSHDSRRERALI